MKVSLAPKELEMVRRAAHKHPVYHIGTLPFLSAETLANVVLDFKYWADQPEHYEEWGRLYDKLRRAADNVADNTSR